MPLYEYEVEQFYDDLQTLNSTKSRDVTNVMGGLQRENININGISNEIGDRLDSATNKTW